MKLKANKPQKSFKQSKNHDTLPGKYLREKRSEFHEIDNTQSTSKNLKLHDVEARKR